MKFRVGDRVIGVGTYDSRDIDGKTGTVVTSSSIPEVSWDFDIHGWGKNGRSWGVSIEQLRILNNENAIIITADGTTTTAQVKRRRETIKTATAKVMRGDTFNQCYGAIIATAKAFDYDPIDACRKVIELFKKDEPKYWSGKAVCTSSCIPDHFTQGMVYEFVDGVVTDNKFNTRFDLKPILDIDQANCSYGWPCDFIEYKGEA